MLDLDHDIVVKLGVEAIEELYCSIGAIGGPVALVEVLVIVNKCAEEDGAIVRSQSSSELRYWS